MYHMIVEQTKEYKNRIEFDAVKNIFIESKYKSLTHARKVPYPYGWIKESGTPPGRHLDIILLSSKEYNLGDEIAINIIGCFVRNDGDNKLIGVLPERLEIDFVELSKEEKSVLSRLYPQVNKGEGWYGAVRSEEIIKDFFTNKQI